MDIQEYAQSVYDKYEAMCGGFPRGECLNIAKEIKQYFNVDIVGGLVGSGVEHWWIELNDGTIIDPMYQNETHRKIIF